jgi:hypothetical protein
MAKTVSGEVQGDERKQTTGEVSKIYGRRQNWGLSVPQDKLVGEPANYPSGVRHRGGVTLLDPGSCAERGNLSS